MQSKLICIECPKGCALLVDIQDCRVFEVTGNQCPKGKEYAVAEVEKPQRVVTTTVRARGLAIKMVPVRTDRPVSKAEIRRILEYLKTITLARPVETGDVLCENILNTGANVIATRAVPALVDLLNKQHEK